MNGGRGVGWGLMKGEGVLLGRRHPCVRSSSREGGGMGYDGGGGCWAVVVRGRSSSVGGGSLLAVCASSLYMGGALSSGGILVVCRWGFFCPWALLVVGVVGCGHWLVVLIVGGGRPLWVLGVVRGAGGLFLGAGLSIGGAGARSRERVVRGCWFVDCGRGGDVSCPGWGDVSCAGWSPLARWDGVTHQTTTMNEDIIIVRRLVATLLSAMWHL